MKLVLQHKLPNAKLLGHQLHYLEQKKPFHLQANANVDILLVVPLYVLHLSSIFPSSATVCTAIYLFFPVQLHVRMASSSDDLQSH